MYRAELKRICIYKVEVNRFCIYRVEHQMIRYMCDQCDFVAKFKSHLKMHREIKASCLVKRNFMLIVQNFNSSSNGIMAFKADLLYF